MIYFIPWALLFVAAIIAVPVAMKLSPSPAYGNGNGDQNGSEDADGIALDDQDVIDDDFAAEAEPIGDDAFAEFN